MARFKVYRQGDGATRESLKSPQLFVPEAHTTFINITHPSQRKETATRKRIAQYIGVNFRNRSKPVARREAKGAESKRNNAILASKRQLRVRGVPIHDWVYRDLHGLRSDPFASYPITPRDWFPEAVDFFLNAWGPTHLLRRRVESATSSAKGDNERETEVSPVHQYFKYSLEHPVMFEALIALSLSNLRVHHWEEGQADKETTYHYGNVLRLLQQTLNADDGFRETAVLWAILALIELEYLVGTNNMTALEAHINGLRRLVDLQGGLVNFDQFKLLGPAIRGVLALWHFLRLTTADELTAEAAAVTLSGQPAVDSDLSKASIDDPGETRSMDIGMGIVRLVGERKLSAPVILQATDIYDNWKDVDLYNNSPYGVNALNMELRERGWNLLACWNLPDHGRLTLADFILLIGLQHTLIDRTHAERYSPFYPPMIIRWVSFCSSCLDVVDRTSDASTADMLIWVCVKLAGTLTATFLRAQSDSEDDPRFQLMVKMMGKYPETREWSGLEQVVKKFHWGEHCLKFWFMVWKMVVNSDTVRRNGYIT